MWWKIRLFLLYKTSNGCDQATHNILLAHFEYPDSKIKMVILWIRIFVSALVYPMVFHGRMEVLTGIHVTGSDKIEELKDRFRQDIITHVNI